MDALKRAAVRMLRGAAVWRDECGTSTLEFTIAAPVVLLFLIGSMIAMLGLFVFGNVSYATGMAARYAALHSSASEAPATTQTVAAVVTQHLWISGSAAQVATTWSAGNVTGSAVTVQTVLALPIALPLTNVRQMTIAAQTVRVVTR